MRVNESAAASTKVVGADAIISRALYRVLTQMGSRSAYTKVCPDRQSTVCIITADILRRVSAALIVCFESSDGYSLIKTSILQSHLRVFLKSSCLRVLIVIS